jgi:hypothetical protein
MPAAFAYRSRAAPLVRPVPQLVDGLSSWRNPSHHEPKLMGIASLHPPYELYAACSVDRVTSPRPANRPAMEISSSMASQCRPTRLNATCSRSADVACNSRGNHASGTPSVRPSDSSTHIVCSSNRTLVADVVMPCLQKQVVGWVEPFAKPIIIRGCN